MKLRYLLPRVDVGALRASFREFGQDLREHRPRMMFSALSALGVSLMTLATPWPIKLALDYALFPGQSSVGYDMFAWLRDWDASAIVFFSAGSVLLVAALKGLLAFGQEVQAKAVGHQLVAQIRLRLFSHIQRLPQSYHDYRETGELLTRLTGDMHLVQEMLVSTMITIVSQVFIIIGMLALMFWMDWRLALVGVIVSPLFMFAAFRFTGRIQKSARKQRVKYGKLVSGMQESLAGISQIKGYGREKQREKLIGKSLGRDAKANLKTTRLTAGYTRTVELITALGIALALWIGVTRVLSGAITAGDLIIFLAYLRGVYRPLQGVARQTAKIAKATVRAEKIIEILNLQPEVKDKENAVSARDIEGGFEFSSVSFSYVNGKSALADFHCVIPAGKTTLILGPTGAGKSTVAKLLLRLYEPSGGRILLDGRDITDFKIRSLRKRITPLSQDTFLFRATVRENIAFGWPHAADEDIHAAARTVAADGFIERLPAGYETQVGEGGLTLSGGQRHLISFARAALRDAPVMTFDEPATGLDVHSENQTKTALRALGKDKTVIIITHRLNFLDLADHVILMRDGTLVEEGQPQALLERGGALARYALGERAQVAGTGDQRKTGATE